MHLGKRPCSLVRQFVSSGKGRYDTGGGSTDIMCMFFWLEPNGGTCHADGGDWLVVGIQDRCGYARQANRRLLEFVSDTFF